MSVVIFGFRGEIVQESWFFEVGGPTVCQKEIAGLALVPVAFLDKVCDILPNRGDALGKTDRDKGTNPR